MRMPLLLAPTGVLIVVLAGCADAVLPRASVTTLDDPGSGPFASVVVGREHTCALAADGSAWCWGSNEHGQLGVPADSSACRRVDRDIDCQTLPRAVLTTVRFRRLTAGGNHTCGISTDSRLYCWGDNEFGQVGDPAIRRTSAPVAVVTSSLYTDVSAGGTHTCAVRSDGVLTCWGSNARGQLGQGGLTANATTPVPIASSLRFAGVASGEWRTCARQGSGATHCWGELWSSQGEDGSQNTRVVTAPEPVASASGTPEFHAISVGASSCGVASDQAVYCWGRNLAGTIGDGTGAGSTLARRVASPVQFVEVSAGAAHTCALGASGSAYCWGANSHGQLGVSPALLDRRCGPVSCALTPVPVTGWRLFGGVAAGLGSHTCGVTLSGNVYCWGAGAMGQRGNGRTTAADWVPTRVGEAAL